MPREVLMVALVMVGVALLLSFIRMLRGPTLPDRVVAVDLMGMCSVSLTVLGAAVSGERWFFDVAVVIALLGFLGTIAYARYAQKESEK